MLNQNVIDEIKVLSTNLATLLLTVIQFDLNGIGEIIMWIGRAVLLFFTIRYTMKKTKAIKINKPPSTNEKQ